MEGKTTVIDACSRPRKQEGVKFSPFIYAISSLVPMRTSGECDYKRAVFGFTVCLMTFLDTSLTYAHGCPFHAHCECIKTATRTLKVFLFLSCALGELELRAHHH